MLEAEIARLRAKVDQLGACSAAEFRRRLGAPVGSRDFFYHNQRMIIRASGEALRIELGGEASAAGLFRQADAYLAQLRSVLGGSAAAGSGRPGEYAGRITPLVLCGFTFSQRSGRRSFLVVPRETFIWQDGSAWLIQVEGSEGSLSQAAGSAKQTVTGGPEDSFSSPLQPWPAQLSFTPGQFSPENFQAAIEKVRNLPGLSKLVLARDLIAQIPAAATQATGALARPDRPDSDSARPGKLGKLGGEPALSMSEPLGRLIQNSTDHDTVYLFDGLFGASPETLLRTDRGRRFESHLLAGTLPNDELDNYQLGAGTSRESGTPDGRRSGLNAHLQLEHDLALEPTLRRLSALAEEPPQVISELQTLPRISHLASYISGRLKDGVSPLQALGVIHPTGAIAGEPRELAIEQIEALEPFDRGLYGGAVGWIDQRGNSEFVLALRCAQLEDGQIRAFAGCGIVHSSDPKKEMRESTLKFRTILEACAPEETGPC